MAATLPQGCGMAIPNRPDALLSLLSKQTKSRRKPDPHASNNTLSLEDKNHSYRNNNLNNNNVQDRQRKQEEEREIYETKLMELEDYLFTDEGKNRIKRFEDRLLM
jgi:hypothetical protein